MSGPASRRALVTGASVAGLSTAWWLARTGWEVEVVERADAFRDGGQNVDVRGAAHEVIERMGLVERIRERTTTEEGLAFLGAGGRLLGRIPVGEERDGPTAELEILRGDLAGLIRDDLPEAVTLTFDDEVTAVEERDDQVHVERRTGPSGRWDLLVVAEGVRSATRDLVFGEAVTMRELGLTIAYGTIPRTGDDDRWWRWYSAAGRRAITLRPDPVGTTRATLAFVDRGDRLVDGPRDQATGRLAEIFADAGWEASRVTAGFRSSSDVYVDRLSQVRMPTWSRGRVVLTGDAAWCVTPVGGGGSSLALLGGYVLAAFLSTAEHEDPGPALSRYEEWMRPLVESTQKLPPGTPGLLYPRTRLGLGVLRAAQRLFTTPPLRRLVSGQTERAGTEQPLPDLRVA